MLSLKILEQIITPSAMKTASLVILNVELSDILEEL